MFKIYVQTREKGKISIDISPTSLIEQLKFRIQKKEGTPKINQCILYRGDYLEDKYTLKHYSLKNHCTVFLFNKKKSLLLKSSNMFNNSTLIDRIRQSCIDIEIDTTEFQAMNLLNEAIFYLDKIFDAKTTKELFTLIFSCFHHFPEQSLDIINKIFHKKMITNSLYLITVSILSYLDENHPEIPIQNFESFILNVRKEILPQIQNRRSSKLIFVGQEVDILFQAELISDIALLSELTNENVLIFYPIILRSNLVHKMNRFIQKVSKANLLKIIPESEFLMDDLFLSLNPENMRNFILLVTEQTFRIILPKINDKIIQKTQFLPFISNPIIEKCIQFDISMNSMTVLFDHFTNYELIMNNLNYLIKYKIQLPDNFVSQIPTFPKSSILLNIVSHPENLPEEILSFALNEAEDIKSYESAFNNYITSPTLSTLEFWKHILTIVSNLSEIEILSSEKLLMKLAICLEDNVPLQKFDEFFDHLIFDNFPPNDKQSIFLQSIFTYLQNEYRNVLLEENRNEQRFERFFDYKIVPHYSLYLLFNFDRVIGKYKTYNAYQLYALYLYDSKNLRFTLDEIQFNLEEESFEFIAKFIREKNYLNMLTNIDNESTLLFIVHSLIFKSRKFVVGKFKGITKENILPIIAIYYNSINSYIKLNRISSEYYELLVESCDLLFNDNVPQIYIQSIDVILSFYFSYCDSIDYSFKLVDTLLNHILIKNKKFKGNTNKIVTMLFRASSENSEKNIEEKISLIFQKYGIELFKFFLKNKEEAIKSPYQINDNDSLFKKIDYRLNLSLFNTDQVTKVIIDEIRQQDNEKIFQTIYFLHKLCSNVPKLQFTDLVNVKEIFEQLLNNEKWEDLMKFIEFSQEYNIKLEDVKKIDDFINHLLHDSDLEQHQILFDILFKTFMKDSYFATKYAMYILERCTINITIKPSSFLKKASYIYYEYKDVFDRVFDEMYAFFPKENIYDYRVLIVKKLYVPKDYSVPRIDCSFIKKLMEENSYQSFICLHKIASYFPFLFEKQFYQVINSVLPSFNYLHLLLDKSNEENAKNVKVYSSAISFLMSCLYSSEFLSDFCFWVFENLTKLSNDQVLCMSSILYLLFDKNHIYRPVLSLAYKYNFLDIIVNLLSRKIEDSQFRKYYLISLSKLAKSYVHFFCNVSKFSNFIFFDMVKKEAIKNPFQLEFDNLSVTPFDRFNATELFIPELYKNGEQFFNKINEKHRFMINSSFTQYPTNEQLIEFLDNFKNKEVEYVKTKVKTIPYLLTVKMVSYLCSQPSWVFSYFCDHYALLKLPEHFIYLDQVATTLIKMSQKKNKNDELCPTHFNPTQYFTSEICHDVFHKFLMNEIETNNEIDDYVYDVISLLVKNEKNMISFLNYISDSLDLVESTLSFRIFTRLIRVINCIIVSNAEISQYFFVICGNKFINIALSPFFRFNESIMFDLVNALCSLGKDLPIRTIQIIGFISTLHPILMNEAMVLYDKLSNDKAQIAFNLIKNTFENEKQKEEPNFYLVKCFIKKDPSMMKKEIPFLFRLIPIYITRFINENYTNDDLFDTICILFDFLAPKRDNHKKTNYYSIKIDEVESTNHLFPPSNNLIQTSKDFWINIYDKNRSFLNKMIEKNEQVFDKLTFLLEFHELVSFPIRLSYFRRKAKEMANQNWVYFEVKRSNIVQDTFEAFSKYETYDLLSRFNVYFVGEYGVDAGGLTREWFSCIIKELFNPGFGLFIKSGKESYFPNSLSFINNNHIEFFKFAGKIIGLALIKNQYVNAHLSFALLKQILHQDVVFKDLEDYDDSLMKSLLMILDTADVKNLDLYFSIDDNQFGKVISTDLIKNGSKIQVTNQNRNDYVNLYADYKLRKSVIKQITAFCDGFDEIVPPKLIQLFSPSELNLMICGIPKIDINDMKMFTQYSPPYNKNHSVIQMFFKMLTKWSHENLAKLLLFITGSSQVPVNGFRDFLDRGNPICISPGGEKDRLPAAHTCSNMLCLPYYDDENDMNNKLLMAIQHCEFGIV